MELHFILIIIVVLIICGKFLYDYINKCESTVSPGLEPNLGPESGPSPGPTPAKIQPIDITNKFGLYFSPNCIHCKQFFPEWKKLIKMSVPNVSFFEVNCYDEPDKCNSSGIQGYPTMLLHKADGSSTQYNGARKTDSIINYINSQISR